MEYVKINEGPIRRFLGRDSSSSYSISEAGIKYEGIRLCDGRWLNLYLIFNASTLEGGYDMKLEM